MFGKCRQLGGLGIRLPAPHVARGTAGDQHLATRRVPRQPYLRIGGDRLHGLGGFVFGEEFFRVHHAISSFTACIASCASGSGWPPLSYWTFWVSMPRQANQVW